MPNPLAGFFLSFQSPVIVQLVGIARVISSVRILDFRFGRLNQLVELFYLDDAF